VTDLFAFDDSAWKIFIPAAGVFCERKTNFPYPVTAALKFDYSERPIGSCRFSRPLFGIFILVYLLCQGKCAETTKIHMLRARGLLDKKQQVLYSSRRYCCIRRIMCKLFSMLGN